MSYTLEEFAELLDDIKNELVNLNENLSAMKPTKAKPAPPIKADDENPKYKPPF